MQENRLTRVSIGFLIAAFGFALLATPFETLLFISMALFFIQYFNTGQYKSFPFQKSDVLILAFFVSTLISGVLSENKAMGIGSACIFIVYYIVMIFFRLVNLDFAKLKKLALFLSLGLILINSLTLLHYLVIKADIVFELFGNTIKIPHNSLVLYSFMEQATRYGFQIAFLSLLLWNILVGFWKELDWRHRGVYLLSLVISSLALLLTLSRGGMLFLSIGAILVIIFNRKWKLLIVLSSACIAIGALAALLYTNNIIKIPSGIVNEKSTSLVLRNRQYEYALHYFNEGNPLFGIGLLNFRDRYNHIETVDFIHNLYIGLLTETGIIGVILFFGFVIFLTIELCLLYIKNKSPSIIIGITALIPFVAVSFFDAVLYTIPVGILLWVFIGLAQNQSFRQNTSIE